MHPGRLLHNISLYLQKNSIFGIKSASLHKISRFAVNDLLFYLFELHIFLALIIVYVVIDIVWDNLVSVATLIFTFYLRLKV